MTVIGYLGQAGCPPIVRLHAVEGDRGFVAVEARDDRRIGRRVFQPPLRLVNVQHRC